MENGKEKNVYSRITWLNITLKKTKVILEELITVIHLEEDHHKNSKTNHRIIARIQPNRLYICFGKRTKAFKRITLASIIKIYMTKE